MNNGHRRGGPRGDPLSDATKAKMTCAACGVDEFDVLPRAVLVYDRLAGPRGFDVVQGQAFRCAGCGTLLEPFNRLKEMFEGEGASPGGIVTP